MVYFNWNFYCSFSRRPLYNFHLMLSNNKLILNSIIAFSFLSLAIAYFIQYILGHEPCNLCLIERIPYLASLILISLIFIINKFEKLISGIVLLFFIFGSVVSFYHVGIEQGFFSESFVTKGGFLAWLGIMFLAGFTPLPFKVFTITSGVIAYNLPVFFFICLFTRGLRFFLVSYLTFLFGKKFGDFIEKRGALWFTLTGIFIVVLAVVLYIIFT